MASPSSAGRPPSRWLPGAAGFGLVLAAGESAAALAIGAREAGLFAWQALVAVGAGLAAGALPLPPRVVATAVLAAVGGFHAGFALHDVDRRFALGDAAVVAAVVLLVAGASWRTLRPPLPARGGALLPFAAAYIVQALWCACFVFPNTDTRAAWLVPAVVASAALAPAAAALVARGLAARVVTAPSRALCALAAVLLFAALPALARPSIYWPAHRFAPAPAPASGDAPAGPDVLLVVLDTVRADRMSLYGHDRPTTPNLERLAARATVYERAQSQGIWTLPGHASLFTGLYPSEHQAEWKDGVAWCRALRPEAVTLAERFAHAGYRTASISANPFLARTLGLAQGFGSVTTARSPTVYLWIPALAMGLANLWDGPVARQRLGPLERTASASATEIDALALEWLERTQSEGPRFLFLNFMEAHDQLRRLPCAAPRFGAGRSWIPDNVAETERVWAGLASVSPANAARLADWYDTQIACLDLHLGELFDELERRGLLDGMLVAVTADHGHLLGEHDAFNHEAEVWRELTHVPLVIKRPGQRVGERCAEPAETADLALVLPWLAGLDLERPLPDSVGLAAADARARIERLPPPAGAPGCPLLPGSQVAVSESPQRSSLAWNPRYATRWTAIDDGSLKFCVDGAGRIQVADGAPPSLERLREPTEAELARATELLAAWRDSALAPLDRLVAGAKDEEEAEELLRLLEQQGYGGN